MASMSFHPFPPTAAMLAERIAGELHLHDAGADRFRLVHLPSATVEAEGSRDDCLARAERMWWDAEAAPTSVVRYHLQDRAAELEFEHWDSAHGRWEPDVFLTKSVVENHLVG